MSQMDIKLVFTLLLAIQIGTCVEMTFNAIDDHKFIFSMTTGSDGTITAGY